MDATNCRGCNSVCGKYQVTESNQLTTENRRWRSNFDFVFLFEIALRVYVAGMTTELERLSIPRITLGL